MTTIAIVGVEFGWGSAGKLRLICDAILRRDPTAEFILLGGSLGSCLLDGIPLRTSLLDAAPSDVGSILRREQVDAAVVVLDPEMASALQAVGCPTVYVDSLPFLWTSADPMPTDVAVYCAQRCQEMPAPAVAALEDVKNLRWVEAIVPTPTQPAPQRRAHLAVINVGGLAAPGSSAAQDYLNLVLDPAIDALEACGFSEVEVCGNVSTSHYVAPAGARVSAGRRTPSDFDGLLQTAGLLVTSPGLTTLLAASAAGTPTVCLPPQNLSQIDNAARYSAATKPSLSVGWPASVMDPERVRTLRAEGEAVAVDYIYSSIRRATVNSNVLARQLELAIRLAARQASRHRDWTTMVDNIGLGGAEEVADIALKLAEGSGAADVPCNQRARTRAVSTSAPRVVAAESLECAELRGLAADTLDVGDAVFSFSASAALLATFCVLGCPGRDVLLPGWSCQSLISAVILAGMRPVLVDVDAAFGMVLPHDPRPGSLMVYAPYGGNNHDLPRVQHWCDRMSFPLILDYAQVADVSVWQQRPRGSVAITSFGPSKPLLGDGGGLMTGPQDAVTLVADFVRGGISETGVKTGLGMVSTMTPSQARAAAAALRRYGSVQEEWRRQTAAMLRDPEGLFDGWDQCCIALSRIPRLGRDDLRPAHPECTYLSHGWRRAASARHRTPHPYTVANTYAAIYPSLAVQKAALTLREALI